MFFERWMNYITEDSSNRVSWYQDSVCNFMDIVKYDRGGVIPTTDSISVVTPTADARTRNTVKWNQATGVWALSNVYPFNISNVQLTNGAAGTLSMEVSFYYERYRFYQPRNTGAVEVVDSIGTAAAVTASGLLGSAAASGATASGATASTTVVTSGKDGKLKP
jgi:hypothetical protein